MNVLSKALILASLLAVLISPSTAIADECPTGEMGSESPCDWTNHTWSYWGSGGSASDCEGCDVDWTWEVWQTDPEKQVLIGNSHDHVRCGEQGTTHTIPCPNGGGGAVSFATTCGTCP